MIILKSCLVENCSKEHQRDLEWNFHKFKNPIKGLSEHFNKQKKNLKLRRLTKNYKFFLILLGPGHIPHVVEAMTVEAMTAEAMTAEAMTVEDQIQEVVMQDLEQGIIQFNQMFWVFLV